MADLHLFLGIIIFQDKPKPTAGQPNSLLLQTSDFEEEYRSDWSDKGEDFLQAITIQITTAAGEKISAHVMVSRQGVRKASESDVNNAATNVTRTVVPIVLSHQQPEFDEKKVVESGLDSLQDSLLTANTASNNSAQLHHSRQGSSK